MNKSQLYTLQHPLFFLLILCIFFTTQLFFQTASADPEAFPTGNPTPFYVPGEKIAQQAQRMIGQQVTGSISGIVFEADGITSVTGDVFVNVFDPISENWIGGATVALDGTYTISTLPVGSYILRAKGPDYALEFYSETEFNGFEATLVEVVDNTPVENINFTLDPGGTISGVVYAEDGVTPLENINVAPVDVWLGACTNSAGEYTLESVPLDEPLVVYSGSGNWCPGDANNYIREWWNEADNPSSATPVILSVIQPNATGIDFTLTLGSSISGVVYLDDGTTPLANMNVGLDNLPIGACTNADGEYTLYGVPVDTAVTLYAGSANWCFNGSDNFIREWWNEVDHPDDASSITLSFGAPDITGINFTLMAGGTISGMVYRADGVTPLENLNVGLDNMPIGTCTNENGEFTLEGIPAGTAVTIYAGSTNWCDGGPSNFLREWWNEVDRPESSTALTITVETPDITGVKFTLTEHLELYLPIITNGSGG